jgi:hypothetical protein
MGEKPDDQVRRKREYSDAADDFPRGVNSLAPSTAGCAEPGSAAPLLSQSGGSIAEQDGGAYRNTKAPDRGKDLHPHRMPDDAPSGEHRAAVMASVGELLEQDFERVLVSDLAIRPVTLNLDAGVAHELDLPVHPRRNDFDADGIGPERAELKRNLCCAEPLDKVEEASELISGHGPSVPQRTRSCEFPIGRSVRSMTAVTLGS